MGGEQIHWDQLLEMSDGSPSSIRPSRVVGRCGEATNPMRGGVLQERSLEILGLCLCFHLSLHN